MYCSEPSSLVAQPRFLASVLHLMSIFIVPLQIFGAYCIIAKTPPAMKSMKWSLLNLHIWTSVQDLAISTFIIPFVMFPELAGVPIGLFTMLGMSTLVQAYIAGTCAAFAAVSIALIYEHRFYLLMARDTKWALIRPFFIFFNYFISMLLVVPIISAAPPQSEAVAAVFQKLPCLPDVFRDAPIFVFGSDKNLFTWVEALFLLFIVAQICFFLGSMVRFLVHELKTKVQSKNRTRLQIKLLRALFIQTSVPLFIYFLPIAYCFFAVIHEHYDQAYNNLAFIAIGMHGLASTSSMIIVHKPYREVAIHTFTTWIWCPHFKKNVKRVGSNVTWQNSFQN